MRRELESFLRRVPDFEQMSNARKVEYLAFFLTEVMQDVAVAPKRIRECFETAYLEGPGNVSDVMSKSRSFVPTKAGQQLQRSIRENIARHVGIIPADHLPEITKTVTVRLE